MLGEAFPDDKQLHHRIRVLDNITNQPLEQFWDEFNSELPQYKGFMYDMEESIITFANGDTEGQIKQVFDGAYEYIIAGSTEVELAELLVARDIRSEKEEPIICEDCERDFTEECDDRSSFEEVGKVQCMDCHNSEDEDDIACGDCDYTISQGEFDSGKGRIMFNDVNEEGTEYRCGCCDDRVADPMGMFPDDEE